MPASVRKDDKAKRIALDILGPGPCGLTDSFGNKKRFVKKKKEKQYADQERAQTNRFQEIGYR